MDTITHGIAGALIGKALFRGDDLFTRRQVSRERVLTWAAMLGAVFPDSDIIRDVLSRDPLLIITWHRSITHSLLCLPAFALGLAALTRWFVRRRRWECPSFALLALVYAAGILSHILLDLLNNFGTMIWAPFSWARPAWDLIFIIDLTVSGIVLLPQVLAGLYETRENFLLRSFRSWGVCVLAALLIAALSHWRGVKIQSTTVPAVIVLLVALFFGPRWRGWGFRVRRAAWCGAGLTVLLVYIGLTFAAHHAALNCVRKFASDEQLEVVALGALPLPPSVWQWDGLIRTPRGVYELPIDLTERDSASSGPERVLEYRLFPEAPVNLEILEARNLPSVQKVLGFARFPVTRFHKEDDVSVVEIVDLRFHSMVPGRPWPFTYRVRIDAAGHVLNEGWVRR
jgi:membrane-bound metal-dependent hydrolase YbcI (DUF457 family)